MVCADWFSAKPYGIVSYEVTHGFHKGQKPVSLFAVKLIKSTITAILVSGLCYFIVKKKKDIYTYIGGVKFTNFEVNIKSECERDRFYLTS